VEELFAVANLKLARKMKAESIAMENIRNQPSIATALTTIASMKQRTLENMMSTPALTKLGLTP